MTSATAPWPFHLLAKPSGAACNLECEYCFYLPKASLYSGSSFRMSDEVMEAYICQYIDAQQGPEITIAWQGGEPTLMGLDFYRRSIKFQQKYRKPGTRILNTIQTNGVLLNDAWCEFFHDANFLVGLSLDGPRQMHDAYRADKGGNSTFDKVMRAVRLLQKHNVEFNILTTVHAANADHPGVVYRFLRDVVQAQFMQFIPIVERASASASKESTGVTHRSVTPRQYGDFLIGVFDLWVQRDVGRVFVQAFDAALANWLGIPSSLCVFSPTCGDALVVEHTGDVYSCDHYVEPGYLVGNILKTHLADIVGCDKQRKFGHDKVDTLPKQCAQCGVRFACHGGCPKDRIAGTASGEPGLNYLCEGYKAFFSHVDAPMRTMASLMRQGRPPAEIAQLLAAERVHRQAVFARAGRNDPCPCRSGRKFKHCHGGVRDSSRS